MPRTASPSKPSFRPRDGPPAGSSTFDLQSATDASTRKPIEFNANLNLLSEMLPRVLGEHISVKVIVPPSLPVINGDGVMIEQLLMNLAVNARDAMPDGGQLTIMPLRRFKSPKRLPGATQDAYAGRFVCLNVRPTYRLRDGARSFVPRFRTILHHETGGSGYRSWPGHRLWHCPRTRSGACLPWRMHGRYEREDGPMSHVRRFDHVGLTVADLDVVTAFFVALGLGGRGQDVRRGRVLDTVCGIPARAPRSSC